MNGKQQLDFVKSNDLLYNELKNNHDQFGIKNYLIVDDTFNDHPDKLNLILSSVEKLDFQPIFWAYHRLDLLATRPETIPILYRIGVRSMYFGIETFNATAGKTIGKGYDRTKQIDTINHLRKNYPDIALHGSFIIGLPGESIADVTDTHRRLCEQDIPLHSWQFQGLKIFKPTAYSFNSEFTNDYSKFGYIDQGSEGKSQINWKNNFMDVDTANDLANQFMSSSRSLDHFWLSGQLQMQLTNLGYKLDPVSFKKFDWHKCATLARPRFISRYKAQLLDLVKSYPLHKQD